MAFRDRHDRLEIKRHLVVCPLQDRERHPEPASEHRPVHMAKEHVANVFCTGNHTSQRPLVTQADVVEGGERNIECRMVQEQKDRLVASLIALLRDEGEIAIVLVEQYFDFAYSLADQFCVLNRGEVVLSQPASAVTRDAILQRVSI